MLNKKFISIIIITSFAAQTAFAMRAEQTDEVIGGGRAVGLEISKAGSSGEIAQLIASVLSQDKDRRREAAKTLSELSKDKFYEEVIRSIGGGKLVGLLRLIPLEEKFDFKVPDLFGILTDEYSEEMLKQVYNSLKPGVYILRSSSYLEDSDDFPLPRGAYKSEFFVKHDEWQFRSFCEYYHKVIRSLTIEGDRMFVLLQKASGHSAKIDYWKMGHKYRWEYYFPSLSGVTKRNPYRITNIVSEVNPGLNTQVVKGAYRRYMNTDVNGKVRLSEEFHRYASFGSDGLLLDLVDLNELKIVKNVYADAYSKENYDELGEFLQDDFLTGLQVKLVKILSAFEQDFGNRELEWSFDSGNLEIYQNTASKVHKELAARPIEIKDVQQDELIAQSNDAFGHKELIGGPLVWVRSRYPDMDADGIHTIFDYELCEAIDEKFGAGYILVCHRQHFSKWGDEDGDDGDIHDIMGKYFYGRLSNIKGWIDTSGNTVAIGAHYASALADKNIAVIPDPNINVDVLEKVCTEIFEQPSKYPDFDVLYSKQPVRLAVDALTGRGQVHIVSPDSFTELLQGQQKIKIAEPEASAAAEAVGSIEQAL